MLSVYGRPNSAMRQSKKSSRNYAKRSKSSVKSKSWDDCKKRLVLSRTYAHTHTHMSSFHYIFSALLSLSLSLSLPLSPSLSLSLCFSPTNRAISFSLLTLSQSFDLALSLSLSRFLSLSKDHVERLNWMYEGVPDRMTTAEDYLLGKEVKVDSTKEDVNKVCTYTI